MLTRRVAAGTLVAPGLTFITENGSAATEISRLHSLVAEATALASSLAAVMYDNSQMTATDAASAVATARVLHRDRRSLCGDRLMLGVVSVDSPTDALLKEAVHLQETAAWVNQLAVSPLGDGVRRWLLAAPCERAAQVLQVVESTKHERTSLPELIGAMGERGVVNVPELLGESLASVDLAIATRRLQQLQDACGDLLAVSKYVDAAAAMEGAGFGSIVDLPGFFGPTITLDPPPPSGCSSSKAAACVPSA